MRIGILTLALHTNYGGLLQAYALQTVLERMGHEVFVLTRDFKQKKNPSLLRFPFIILKRVIKKYLLRTDTDIFSEYHHNKYYRLISKNTQEFIDSYINAYCINSLEELSKNSFDCIIVGSDQIWRKEYFEYQFNTNIKNAYLFFAHDWSIKRYSYAASFGTDDWDYSNEDTETCRRLIQQFDSVSVRELGAIKLCKEKFGIDVVHVLDPTLLLNKDDYIALVKKKDPPKNIGSLFVYFLDVNSDKMDVVTSLSQLLNMIPFGINISHGDEGENNRIQIVPSVETWINSFNEADFIITDSFHACVFSILFNKPFIVVDNVKRGSSRIDSLLGILELRKRIIHSMEDIQVDEVSQYLCEPDAYGKLDKYIQDSYSFLSCI